MQPQAENEKSIDSSSRTMPKIELKKEPLVLANADSNKSTIPATKSDTFSKSPISPVWLTQKKEEFEKMVNDSMQSPKSESNSTNPKTKRRKSKAQPMPPSTTANEGVEVSMEPASEQKDSFVTPIPSVWLAQKEEIFAKMINDCNQSTKLPAKSTDRNAKRRSSKPQVTPPTDRISEGKAVLQTSESAVLQPSQPNRPSNLNPFAPEFHSSSSAQSNRHDLNAQFSSTQHQPSKCAANVVYQPQTHQHPIMCPSNPIPTESVPLVQRKGVSNEYSPTIDDTQSATTAKSARETEEAPKMKPRPSIASAKLLEPEVVVQQDVPKAPFISPKIVWRLNKAAEAKAKKAVKSNWLEDIGSEVMKWQSKQEKANVESEGSSRNSKKRRGAKPATAESSNKRSSNTAAQLSRLPNEILDVILGYALLEDKPIHVDTRFRPLPNKRLSRREREAEKGRSRYDMVQTCKDFYDVGRPLYYSLNTFTVSLGAFVTLQNTMRSWPKINNATYTLNPALANVQRLIIVESGPGEGVSNNSVWQALPQFLKGFKQLMQVELDFRFCGWSEIDWHTSKEQYYYDTVPPSADLKRKMEMTGVRLGWTLKEDRENRREGIKDGALMVRLLPAKKLAETFPDMKNSVEGEIIDGLERYLIDVKDGRER